MSSNEASISFSMGGYSFKAEEITDILGIEPTSVLNGNTTMGDDRPAISSWELTKDKLIDDDVDVIKMTNDLIKELEPIKDKLLLAIENYNLVPKIVIRLALSDDKETAVPEIGFGSRAVKFLASIGAYIEVESTKR